MAKPARNERRVRAGRGPVTAFQRSKRTGPLAGAGPVAIEVKSGKSVGSLEGLAAFRDEFGAGAQTLIAGTGGVPLEEFLAREPRHFGTAGNNTARERSHGSAGKIVPGQPQVTYLRGRNLEAQGQQERAAKNYYEVLQSVRKGPMAEYCYNRLVEWGDVKKQG